ncbi:MAG TPA: CHRD domain-containing protein [Steroidobacteraceae bacterium]|nr:CHRD domain-containing protein [Steroidobacteraceae bacterium]
MSSILQRAAFATLLAASFSLASAKDEKITLTGAQEVPAVTTDAKGEGMIKIGMDKSVSGKITTTGMEATMGHIHEGAAPGQNGPPIITLEKAADGSWAVPAGSKLTDEQYDAFKAGKLYVNIHSAAHKGGEIRAPLKP